MKYTSRVIRIPKPDLFSFTECLYFLDRGYDDCLYSIVDGQVIKPLRLNGQQILIRIVENDSLLEIKLLNGDPSPRLFESLVDYVSSWFDLERNIQPFYGLLNKDKRLSWMTERYRGLRLIGVPDLFEALCWCVIGQQINLTFAYRLKRALVETYGTSLIHNSKRYFYFPYPEVLAGLKISDLKELQFSRQKAEYMIGIASKFVEGSLSKKKLISSRNSNKMLKMLKEIRGVGDWTANYVLMKSLQKTDCITYGDTGLQSAVSSILNLKRKPNREEIETFFEPFAGWESYLIIYLWRTLS